VGTGRLSLEAGLQHVIEETALRWDRTVDLSPSEVLAYAATNTVDFPLTDRTCLPLGKTQNDFLTHSLAERFSGSAHAWCWEIAAVL
jgi:hypothetical protein